MSDLTFVRIWLMKNKVGDGKGGIEKIEITYPPIFDDETLKGVPYLYQETDEIGENVREFLAGFIVPGTPISRIQEILEDPDIDPMTEDEVDELGKLINPERDFVSDSDASILALSIPFDERTAKMKAALDPQDPEPGISHIPPYGVREHLSTYFGMAEKLEE